MSTSTLPRRDFLKMSTLASGALLVKFSLWSCQAKPEFNQDLGELSFDASLVIPRDGDIVFTCPRTEMGQAINSGLAAVLCEELEYPLDKLIVKHAHAHDDFAHPEYRIQLTGGSSSMRTAYLQLRLVGANLKRLFELGAAQRWEIEPKKCIAKAGYIVRPDSDRKYSYQELIAYAQIQTPDEIRIKTPDEFKYIGKNFTRVDDLEKIEGRATYGIDVQDKNGYSAFLIHSPVLGGTVKSFDDGAAKDIKGYVGAVKVARGLAVVAEKYWQAKRAGEAMKVHWEPGEHAGFNTEAQLAEYQKELASASRLGDGTSDWEQAYNRASIKLDAEYRVPYLAHATMEPMNCNVKYTTNSCEIWVPTQSPQIAQALAAAATGLSTEQVKVHCTQVGGGFGRRVEQDYVQEAVEIAMQFPGKMIKTIWSRESDIRNDFYRPMSVCKMRASLNRKGKTTAWSAHVATQAILNAQTPNIMQTLLPSWMPGFLSRGLGSMAGFFLKGASAMEGLEELPYSIVNVTSEWVETDSPVPVGFWRSVGHSQNAFFLESFIDEMAHAAKTDPYEFRRKLLAHQERHLAVLDKVAKMASWGKKKNVHQGIAIHESFGSIVAQVVEVRVRDNQAKVLRVYCCIDCGTAVNPDIVEAQMEGSIIFALTAALTGKIDYVDGQVKQGNFNDYPLLRINETPKIKVAIIDSLADPQGVGEPGVPPLAPALGNALFAASGQRQRELPLNLKT